MNTIEGVTQPVMTSATKTKSNTIWHILTTVGVKIRTDVYGDSGSYAITVNLGTSGDTNQTLGLPSIMLSEGKGGQVFFVLFLVTIGLTIIGGNGLFIVAYFASKMKTFRRKNNYMYFCIHLAFADLLVGLSIPYHVALYLLPWLWGSTAICMARYATIYFPMAASMVCQLFIATDRYIAVTRQLQYPVLVTRCRAHIAMLVGWGTSLLLGIIGPAVSVQKVKVTSPDGKPVCDFARSIRWWYLGCVTTPLIAIIAVILGVLYLLILKVIARSKRDVLQCGGTSQTDTSRALKNEFGAAKTGALVVGIFLFCWLPFCLITSIQVYAGQQKNPTLQKLRTLAMGPAIVNSAVNCIVYAVRMPKFRNMVKELFGASGTTGELGMTS